MRAKIVLMIQYGSAADQLKWKRWLIFEERNRIPDVFSTCSRDPSITDWSPWVHVDESHGAETVGGSKWGKAELGWQKKLSNDCPNSLFQGHQKSLYSPPKCPIPTFANMIMNMEKMNINMNISINTSNINMIINLLYTYEVLCQRCPLSSFPEKLMSTLNHRINEQCFYHLR